MSQLFFKKPYQDAIRAGTKTTTIRRWSKPMLRQGQRAFSPGLGWLAIDTVEMIEIETMTEQDAVADGFTSAGEMMRSLLEIYPLHVSDEKKWFRVRFGVHSLQAIRPRTVDESPTLF